MGMFAAIKKVLSPPPEFEDLAEEEKRKVMYRSLGNMIMRGYLHTSPELAIDIRGDEVISGLGLEGLTEEELKKVFDLTMPNQEIPFIDFYVGFHQGMMDEGGRYLGLSFYDHLCHQFSGVEKVVKQRNLCMPYLHAVLGTWLLNQGRQKQLVSSYGTEKGPEQPKPTETYFLRKNYQPVSPP